MLICLDLDLPFYYLFTVCSLFFIPVFSPFLPSFGIFEHFLEFHFNLPLFFFLYYIFCYRYFQIIALRITKYMLFKLYLESVFYHFKWSIETMHHISSFTLHPLYVIVMVLSITLHTLKPHQTMFQILLSTCQTDIF